MLTGVDECKQWQPENVSTSSSGASSSTTLHSSAANLPADSVGSTPLGLVPCPGSTMTMPTRPTLVEVGGRSRPVDSLDDMGPSQQFETKPVQQKQQARASMKEPSKLKQPQPQQQYQVPPLLQHRMNLQYPARPLLMQQPPYLTQQQLQPMGNFWPPSQHPGQQNRRLYFYL